MSQDTIGHNPDSLPIISLPTAFSLTTGKAWDPVTSSAQPLRDAWGFLVSEHMHIEGMESWLQESCPSAWIGVTHFWMPSTVDFLLYEPAFDWGKESLPEDYEQEGASV